MTQVPARRLQQTIGVLQIAIVALVVITALIHLQRGIGMSFGGGPGGPPPGSGQGGPPPGGAGGAPGGLNLFQYLPTLFLLNGIGYLVLGAALYLPALARFRPLVRWLLIIFAAVTFVLYFVMNGFRLNPIAILDKLVELVLIVLLFVDGRRSSGASAAETVAA
jgi:hypothetical protein